MNSNKIIRCEIRLAKGGLEATLLLLSTPRTLRLFIKNIFILSKSSKLEIIFMKLLRKFTKESHKSSNFQRY